MKVMKIQNKENPVVLVRAMVELEVSPDNLFTLVYDLNWRNKWDSVLSQMEIIHTYSDIHDVMYSFYKSPMGVSNRDFLQHRYIY